MARKEKFDGVLTAVRYTPDGQVDWVRAYERRGPAFSDRLMLTRTELVEKLKAGKKFVVGERIAYQGGNFEISDTLALQGNSGGEVLVTGKAGQSVQKDNLAGVPVL